MADQSIERKVFFGFAFSVGVLIFVSSLALYRGNDYIRGSLLVRHTQNVLLSIERILLDLNEAESAQRGYLIVQNPLYLGKRQSAINAIWQNLNALRGEVRDNPKEESRQRALTRAVALRLVFLNSVLETFQKSGFDQGAEILRKGLGDQQMEVVQSIISRMKGAEDALLVMRERKARDAARDTLFAISAALLGTIILLVFLSRKIKRELDDRLTAEKQLTEAARIESTHRRLFTLFASSFDSPTVIEGTLSILAEGHPFPLSALYRYNEWAGIYRLESRWGVTGAIALSFREGEGLIGQAAKADRSVVLTGNDIPEGYLVETGLFSWKPGSVLILPVSHQEKKLAVLVLASPSVPSELELDFIERLRVELAVALKNLKHHEDLEILMEELRRQGEEVGLKNLQLEQASRMKTEFLANMSHELRTPLNAIIGFSEMLKDGLLGPLSEPQKSPVSDIFNSGLHLLSLINDILDLSKIESGKESLELEMTSLGPILLNAVSVVRERATAHRIRIDSSLSEIIEDSVVLDPRKIKQILFNLLSNAVKFTPDGGSVSIVARRRTDLSGSPYRQWPSWLEIEVKDTGIGIAPEDQARLFQAFVQIDSSLSKRFAGTGLGLMLVKRLTELHGGKVLLESAVDVGTTVTVHIPWRSHGQIPTAPSQGPSIPSGSSMEESANKKNPDVLILEDQNVSRQILEEHFLSLQIRTRWVTNVQEAMREASQSPPSLLAIDLGKDGSEGWLFFDRIRDSPELSRIPLLILSLSPDLSKGFSIGISKVLTKPVDRDSLLAALREMGLDPEKKEKGRILVIDDDPRAVEFMGKFLSHAGFNVSKAYSGKEGVAIAERHHPDLILLDLMMPDMNGFQVAQTLGTSPETQSIPILAVTAKIVTLADRERLNGYIVNVLEKSSFSSGTFMSEVKRALHLRSAGSSS